MSSLLTRIPGFSPGIALAIAMSSSTAVGNPTKEAISMGADGNPPGTSWTNADEASIFTPAGFDKPGKAVQAAGPNVGHLKIVVRDEKSGKPTFCRVNVVGPDGNYYQPPENRLTQFGLTAEYESYRVRPGQDAARQSSGRSNSLLRALFLLSGRSIDRRSSRASAS